LNQILEFKSTTGSKNDGDEAPARQERRVGLFWVAKQREEGRECWISRPRTCELSERKRFGLGWGWVRD